MPQTETLIADFRQRWLRMPHANRMWLIVLTALMFAVAGWSFLVKQPPESEWLLAGQTFSARDLIELEGVFAKAGLVDYEVVDSRVRIPHEQRSLYVAAVVDADVVGEKPIAKTSFYETTGDRLARERVNLERTLGEHIRQFGDIDDASVRIDEAITGQGFRRTKQVTSMVVVKPSTQLNAERVRSICRLVASSKVELTESNVTVTDLSNGRCYTGGALAGVEGHTTDDVHLHRRDMEQRWSSKIQDALHSIPGARVATSVDLQEQSEGGLNLRDVAVSVSVPQSYYRQVWQSHREHGSRPLAREPEPKTLAAIEHQTRQRIEQIVLPLLPKQTVVGELDPPRVSVVSFPDLVDTARTSQIAQRPFGLNFTKSWWPVAVLIAAIMLGWFALRGIGRDLHRVWGGRESVGHRSRRDSRGLRVVRSDDRRGGERNRERNRERYSDPHHRENKDREYTDRVGDREGPADPSMSVNSHDEREVDLGEVRAANTDVATSAFTSHNHPPGVATSEAHSTRNADRSLIAMAAESTDEVFREGPSAINEELTHLVRANPDAASELLKKWIDKAG